jgi:hypothetical protein
MIRYNSQAGTPVLMENYDGVKWSTSWGVSSPLSGTLVTTNGAASYTISGVPTGVVRITFAMSLVSNGSGVANLLQLGTGGVVATSGYTSVSAASGGPNSSQDSSNGFIIFSNNPVNQMSGVATLMLIGSNQWSWGYAGSQVTQYGVCGGGIITLTGPLDTLRFAASGGTFSGGVINVLYG